MEERREKYAALSRRAQSLPKSRPEAMARTMEQENFVRSTLDRLKTQAKRVNDLKPGGAEFLKHFQSSAAGLMSAI
jgi:ferritin